MSRAVVIVCDICGTSKSEAEAATGEMTMSDSRWSFDICSGCVELLSSRMTRLEKFECPDCDRTFDKKQGVIVHRARTHGVTE